MLNLYVVELRYVLVIHAFIALFTLKDARAERREKGHGEFA